MLQNFKATRRILENRQIKTLFRLLSSNDKEKNYLKTTENETKTKLTNSKDKTITLLTGYMKKFKSKDDDEEAGEERKGPFKNYFEEEERDKNKIMKYEEFIDRNTRNKDRENFIVCWSI
jgi:hypothetical protein